MALAAAGTRGELDRQRRQRLRAGVQGRCAVGRHGDRRRRRSGGTAGGDRRGGEPLPDGAGRVVCGRGRDLPVIGYVKTHRRMLAREHWVRVPELTAGELRRDAGPSEPDADRGPRTASAPAAGGRTPRPARGGGARTQPRRTDGMIDDEGSHRARRAGGLGPVGSGPVDQPRGGSRRRARRIPTARSESRSSTTAAPPAARADAPCLAPPRSPDRTGGSPGVRPPDAR